MPAEHFRPFLWAQGQSLAAALAWQGLTLDDKPLFAIRLLGVKPGGNGEPEADPVFEREQKLLD